MPLALTPRLSIVIPIIMLTLVVAGELYGASQQVPWPLYLSGQVGAIVPSLVSLTWELAFVYWVLARCTQLVGQWGASVMFRYGRTSTWLIRSWMRELALVMVITIVSMVAGTVTRIIVSGADVAALGDAYFELLGTNSLLAALQLQVDFLMLVSAAMWIRRPNAPIVLLTAAAALGALRRALVTPLQNFGPLVSESWWLWATALVLISLAIIIATTLFEGRIQHDRSGD